MIPFYCHHVNDTKRMNEWIQTTSGVGCYIHCRAIYFCLTIFWMFVQYLILLPLPLNYVGIYVFGNVENNGIMMYISHVKNWRERNVMRLSAVRVKKFFFSHMTNLNKINNHFVCYCLDFGIFAWRS